MVSYLRSLPTPSPQPEPPDYAGIYRRLILECATTSDSMSDKDFMKRLSYLGVKGGPIIYGDAIGMSNGGSLPPKKLLDCIWQLINLTQAAIAGLTPNELLNIFPVEKRYDGERSGAKDYFSTMEELWKIGMDAVIGEHVRSLLFDYQNPYVRKFNVFKYNVLDIFRAYEGKPSMIVKILSVEDVSLVTSAPQPLWLKMMAGDLPITVSDRHVIRWPRGSLGI